MESRQSRWPGTDIGHVAINAECKFIDLIIRECEGVRSLKQLDAQFSVGCLIGSDTIRCRCFRIVDVVADRELASFRLQPIDLYRTRILAQIAILLDRKYTDVRIGNAASGRDKWGSRKRNRTHGRPYPSFHRVAK